MVSGPVAYQSGTQSLGAAVLDAVVERAGIDGGHIDDVIVGCVTQSVHKQVILRVIWCWPQ